ncbi:MAG: PEP-CTERM sorting domain-containing protein [Acidobacteriota bacterium]|jgi:hypothetical protein
MIQKLLTAIAFSVLGLPAAVFYQQDFESSNSIPSGFSGAGSIETTGGLSAFGFGSRHLFNGGASTTQLALTNLAPHTSITLTFNLAIWDSADSATDLFSVMADNITLFNGPIGNYSAAGPGTFTTAPFAADAPNYGQNPSFRDSARAVSFTFSHSASSLTLSWRFPNTQGAPDEAFGIDNIVVSDNNTAPNNGEVPEPATIALTGMALAALTFRKRR